MKIIAIVQAGQDSKRFPNKVLKKIKKKNIVEIIYSRLKKSKHLSKIVFAIPKKDKLLKKTLLNNKINYYLGSEENVLQRYYECALKFKADIVVRITADCPFVDYMILDNMIKLFLKEPMLIIFVSISLEYSFEMLSPQVRIKSDLSLDLLFPKV